MTLWNTIEFQLATQYLFTITLLIFLFIHVIRLHYIHKNRSTATPDLSRCWKFDIRHSSYLALICPLLIVLDNVILFTANQLSSTLILTDSVCVFATKFTAYMGGTSKFAMHAFVLQRTRIHHGKISNIWQKIGAFLLLSDILWVLHGMVGIATIDAFSERGICFVAENTSMSIFLWYEANDIVIGLYCLLVFVLPLRKVIKLEKQMTASLVDLEAPPRSIAYVVRRIVIFSSIALISSIIFVPLSAKFKHAAYTIMNFDRTLNAVCIVMQFAAVDTSEMPKVLRCCFFALQCGHGTQAKRTDATADHEGISVAKEDTSKHNASSHVTMTLHPYESERQDVSSTPKFKDDVSSMATPVEPTLKQMEATIEFSDVVQRTE